MFPVIMDNNLLCSMRSIVMYDFILEPQYVIRYEMRNTSSTFNKRQNILIWDV